MYRDEKRLERQHGVKVGDIEMPAIREDARKDQNAFSPVKIVSARVAGLYEHFVLVTKPMGMRECFGWQEFERIRRN